MTIFPGDYQGRPTFSLGTYQAGATTFFEVQFAITGNITSDGKIQVYLPPDFRGVTSASVDAFLVQSGSTELIDHVSDLGEPVIIYLTGDVREGVKLNITLLLQVEFHIIPAGSNVTIKIKVLSAEVSAFPVQQRLCPVRTLLANDDPIDEASIRLIEIDVRMML